MRLDWKRTANLRRLGSVTIFVYWNSCMAPLTSLCLQIIAVRRSWRGPRLTAGAAVD
jgi:hypothetical protein